MPDDRYDIRRRIEEVFGKGGPGSGNFGHAGRPGEVGGSAPGEETLAGTLETSEAKTTAGQTLRGLLGEESAKFLPTSGRLGELVSSAENRLSGLLSSRQAKENAFTKLASQDLLERRERFALQVRNGKERIKALESDANMTTEARDAALSQAHQDLDKWQDKLTKAVEEIDTRREVYSIMRQAKSAIVSHRSGKIALSDSDAAKLVASTGDVYYDHGWRPYKGSPPYRPELFRTSDISGKPIRHYIKLPDGRIAHPDEIVEARSRQNVIVIGEVAVPSVDWTR